jgi:hypothetical protein
MKTVTLLFAFLSIAILFACQSPETAKKRPGVKYLHVTVDIPDNLIVDVQTNYESIKTCWGCKSLSEQDWNWVALRHREDDTIYEERKDICIPLFINKTTICKWILYSVEIGLSPKKGGVGITGFSITFEPDTSSILKFAKLADTTQFDCYRLTNQFTSPDKVYIACDQRDRTQDDPLYTFKGISGDTAYVAVIAHNDNGPIRYLDTTVHPNKYRVFGKDEKIPGLNDAERK